MKKPLPPVYFLLILVGMIAGHVLVPITRYWEFPASTTGLVPIIIGVALNVIADRLFIHHQTTVKPFEESTALVTTFPFSVTRNPMYLGVSFMLLGVAMLLGTLSPLLLAMVFPFVMDVSFIRAEERMLTARFGEDWEHYRAKVRRWL